MTRDADYMDANRAHWDEAAPLHAASSFYDVDEFRRNPDRLKPVELAEVGDVRGKTLLHLQCHFGVDTLSWARQGAIVTGVDFSPNAVRIAGDLARELQIDARFIESNVYDLPSRLDEQFDVVFTSYGVLGWLPDLKRWAQVAAHFVKPGGIFYIAEFHPVGWIFDDAKGVEDLHVRYLYFPTQEPERFDFDGTYGAPDAKMEHRTTYNFPYPLGDVVTAIIESGLQIEYLHEFPFSTYQFLPFTRAEADGTVRLTKHDGSVPLLFSIRAHKPT